MRAIESRAAPAIRFYKPFDIEPSFRYSPDVSSGCHRRPATIVRHFPSALAPRGVVLR
ncbi:hypothetical protein [Paraburkholderia sp. 40]|uniref:hypothetical protein n=1 Tax=Paraburkholderia sp. 40 TaxID=2991059 RepID=UPI003D1A18D0